MGNLPIPSAIYPILTIPGQSGRMTAYRRLRLPGATYFFTLCLDTRGSTVLVDEIAALRRAYAATLRELCLLYTSRCV